MDIDFKKILDYLMKFDWATIIQGIIGIWMAIVATIALNVWKKQIKAQRYIEFVDELTDTINNYILSFSPIISWLQIAKTGVEIYMTIDTPDKELKRKAAVEFIKHDNGAIGKQIKKEIETIKPILTKMKTLIAKGQVLGINNYSRCLNVCQFLEYSYSLATQCAFLIDNVNLNWQNPEVKNALDKVLAIEPSKIEEDLKKQNKEYIEFASNAYKNI